MLSGWGDLIFTKISKLETVCMELSCKYLLKQMSGVNDLEFQGPLGSAAHLPALSRVRPAGVAAAQLQEGDNWRLENTPVLALHPRLFLVL